MHSTWVRLLKQEIKADPRPVPRHPPYPDKAFHYAQQVLRS